MSRPLFILAREIEALKLCNGLIDTSLLLIPEEIRALEKRGFITRCERGDAIAPEQTYKLYPARYIRTAHWSVTGRCNYRCKHCYMSAPDAKYGELSHEKIMSIVQRLIDTRATEVLAHHPDCRTCKHALECLAGCRASALESNPSDILSLVPAACAIFKGGWVEKIQQAVKAVRPDVQCD